MKQHRTIIFALATLLFGGIAFLLSDHLHTSSGTLTLEYPSHAVTDAEGGICVIDRSMRRIVRMDKDNTVLFAIEGGHRDPGTFFYAYDIAMGPAGDLYVHNGVLDEPGFFMVREEILHYSPTGEFAGVIASRNYGADERRPELVQRTRLAGLSATAERIRWFEIDGAGIHRYHAYPGKEAVENTANIPLADADLLVAGIDEDAAGNIIFVSRRGEVVRVSGGTATALFNADAETARSIPQSVSAAGGRILFTDLGRRAIRLLGPDGGSTVLDNDMVKKAMPDMPESVFYRLSDRAGVLATCTDYGVIISTADSLRLIDSGTITAGRRILFALGWFSLSCALICLVITGVFFFLRVMKRRVSLVLKQLLIFIPIIILSIIFIARGIITDYSERYQSEIMGKISQAVQLIPRGIDTTLFSKLARHSDYLSPEYRRLRADMLGALNYNRDDWNRSFYFVLYRVIDDKLYGFMYLNGGIGLYYPFATFEDPESPYRKAWAGEIAAKTESDSWGSWLYAVGPVRNASGKIVGLIEVGTDLYSFRKQNEQMILNTLKGTVAVTVVFIIAVILVTYFLLVSIRILRNGVMKLSQGEWETKVAVRNRNDEVADLSEGFNRMSEYILNYISEITQLNRVYRRFVPEQFIQYLGKAHVTEIELGDQVQKEMTVMFSDIRSFTTLSESMSPKENFDFLNAYLRAVGPVIRDCHGFIDKYIGDAIMALFPHSPDDAVEAAIGLFQRLETFNAERVASGAQPITIGLALHTGQLMLGILGEEERMEGTVISDNVNLASRLEGLTKHFGAQMILSSATRNGLKHASRYMDRTLGRIQVKGKKGYIEILELLDVLPQKERMMKIKTRDVFTKGVALYQEGRFDEAEARFNRILGVHPDDRAAQLYRDACSHARKETGIWDGTIVMKEK